MEQSPPKKPRRGLSPSQQRAIVEHTFNNDTTKIGKAVEVAGCTRNQAKYFLSSPKYEKLMKTKCLEEKRLGARQLSTRMITPFIVDSYISVKDLCLKL
jgi:hypothetical protein